jgi:hypothetical protein
VQFDLIDSQGHEQTAGLFPEKNGEANLRFGDIIDQFATSAGGDSDSDGDDDSDDEQQRIDFARSLSASLAGAMFARHPAAAAVRVRLEEFVPIDMADYRAGARADWHPLYQAKFTHGLAARKEASR